MIGDQVRCIEKVGFCYMKLLLSSPKLKCVVSKLSHWFTDNLVLSIQMSNVIALAMVKAIKMCDWKCREVVQKQDE